MKSIFIILLFISCAAKSQVIADTTYYSNGAGGYIKVVNYHNSATTTFFTKSDSATSVSTPYRLKDSLGIIRTLITSASSAIQSSIDLKANIASPTFTGTVGGITAAMVGLGNVTNESKATMFTSPTFTGTTSGITKTMVGLSNVDNTTDAAKPVSTAQQTALDLKANLASPTFTGTVGGITKSMVGLGSVDNTSDAGKPVSTAQQTALNLKANLASPTFTGTVAGITATMVGLGNVTNESKATMFTSPTFTGTPVIPGYQPLATNLTSIGALANVSGFIKNDGAGNFSYANPAGSGTVTDVSIVSANGISGSVATSTSTPAITLSLGAITPTTVNGVTITNLLLNTTTSGVAASPTASGTVTVTHGLGRVPTTIRIYGIGAFAASTSATPTPFSMGIWNSSGNRCVYMTSNGTTAQASQTSTTFAVFLATSAGNTVSGVIQNVTSTGFDIVWTEVGTSAAQNFMWEAQ